VKLDPSTGHIVELTNFEDQCSHIFLPIDGQNLHNCSNNQSIKHLTTNSVLYLEVSLSNIICKFNILCSTTIDNGLVIE